MASLAVKFTSLVPKIIGQATASGNLQPASKVLITWNLLYILIYFFILVWTIYSVPHKEDKLGYKGYSFISQIKYCVHLYGSSILLFFINIRVTYYRENIRQAYNRLLEMVIEFKDLKIPKHSHRFEFIFVILVVLVLSAPIALLIDVLQTPRAVPTILWICLYLPGFSCMVYIADYIAKFSRCSNRFMTINKKLEEFAYTESSCTEIYLVRKRKVRPNALLKIISHDGQIVLDKLVMLYDEICEITHVLNKTCGLELAIYFGLTSANIISLGYTAVLDLMAISRGDSISETNTRACDFWGVINFFTLITITIATAQVKHNFKKTPKLLHRLINIYVDLEPLADMYSLQMSHQGASVTAAGFFALDRSIFLSLLSTWITYLVILIQFNG